MSFLKPYTTLLAGILLGAVVAPKALKMLHK
jgi:hypothetical protein